MNTWYVEYMDICTQLSEPVSCYKTWDRVWSIEHTILVPHMAQSQCSMLSHDTLYPALLTISLDNADREQRFLSTTVDSSEMLILRKCVHL